MSDNGTATATPTRVRLAEELRALLARRKMSAAELARQIGATQPYLWRRMSGEIAFDLDDLDAIALVLEIEPVDLLRAATAGSTLRDPLPAPRRPADNRPAPAPAPRGRSPRTRPPYGHGPRPSVANH